MPSKPKKQTKTKKQEPEFKCGFCDKPMVFESGIIKHLCVGKQRDQEKDEKHIRYAYQVYRKFYAANWKGQKEKGWGDFIKSRFYNDFVKVGRYIQDINAINAPQFVDFLVRSSLPVKQWTSPVVYETFVHELTKKESPGAAVERNILLMQQWATDTGNNWTDFFKKVSPAQATLWIKTGRISPWVIYICASSENLLMRLSDEQVEIVSKYIDPEFWAVRMQGHKDEVEFLRAVFDEAGV
jgi:hypothetical protein